MGFREYQTPGLLKCSKGSKIKTYTTVRKAEHLSKAGREEVSRYLFLFCSASHIGAFISALDHPITCRFTSRRRCRCFRCNCCCCCCSCCCCCCSCCRCFCYTCFCCCYCTSTSTGISYSLSPRFQPSLVERLTSFSSYWRVSLRLPDDVESFKDSSMANLMLAFKPGLLRSGVRAVMTPRETKTHHRCHRQKGPELECFANSFAPNLILFDEGVNIAVTQLLSKCYGSTGDCCFIISRNTNCCYIFAKRKCCAGIGRLCRWK